MLTIHWIDPAAACEYSYLLSALIKSARGFDNALTMPERLDKATRRREPVRAFLHYVEKLSKAKRRGANPRKIARAESQGLARPPLFGTPPIRMWNWPLAPLLQRAGNQVVREMPSHTRL